MRIRLIALGSASAAAALVIAGCASGSVPAGTGASSSAAATSAAPASTEATGSSGSATGTASGSAPAVPACPAGQQAGSAESGDLTGMEFVSAVRGWAVGQDTILATTDGGVHWTPQLSGSKLGLTSVDFISEQDGWAVGASRLLATTDGGTHWKSLPEPCPVIRAVHFISPTKGYAVAGGRELTAGTVSPVPADGGVVLTTADGGHSWHPLSVPADAQTVCFSDSRHGYLGAAGQLYATADGGQVWMTLTQASGRDGAGDTAVMSVECASGAAWAERAGPGAGMSQQPHVGYHADQTAAAAIFAEQYFQGGAPPATGSPGSDAGPFSAIDSAEAVFVDSCPACGYGTAPWGLASRSGAVFTQRGNVGDITVPAAASFLSAQVGWVSGHATVYGASGASKSQERIVATADGGRTWHVQWKGPWTTAA